ncbi:MAG: thiamine pyrophosphate-binding protein, partial [Chloroflexota bacterium]
VKPEFITAMHEESSAAMAHGFAKAAGRPIAIMAHSTVGLQHAAMAVYNAWADRVPIVLMAGNLVDAAKRRPGVEWYHSAIDPAALLRDITKWDDQPASLQHFSESLVRGYKIATTPPMEPVLIVADADLQETGVENESQLSIPKMSPSIPPQGDANAVREAARLLAAAQNPVILADRATRTPDGVKLMIQLAEVAGLAETLAGAADVLDGAGVAAGAACPPHAASSRIERPITAPNCFFMASSAMIAALTRGVHFGRS